MDEFSGYIAADELYDGPYCVLSIVEGHTFKRISYKVLDHDPTHDDICEFHVLKELTKAVLRAVAKVRKELAAKKPKLSRGRPASKQAKRTARRKKQIERKIGDLFEHRHLFVRHHLTDTALAKLAKLRRRVPRFKQVGKTLSKLFSPNLDKALTFLDDKLLPSTSNAVQRGYRRHRKMQKSIYRVRTMARLIARIALDMLRDLQSLGRSLTTKSLHQARAG